jgi:hypothetical protein
MGVATAAAPHPVYAPLAAALVVCCTTILANLGHTQQRAALYLLKADVTIFERNCCNGLGSTLLSSLSQL